VTETVGSAPLEHIIISVHGIRTYGDWQQRLGLLLDTQERSIKMIAFRYGYFGSLSFLIPGLRYFVIRRFRKILAEKATQWKGARVDIIAHSFGTYVVAWALARAKSGTMPRVHTMILCGSVLKQLFPWDRLVGSDRPVRQVINDCGAADYWPLVAGVIGFGMGAAGRLGFAGPTGVYVGVINRFYPVDHGGFFTQDYMIANWLPALRQESIEFGGETVPPKAGWSAAFEAYADPLKLLTLLAPLFVAFSIWHEQQVAITTKQETIEEFTLRTKRPQDMTKRDQILVRAACDTLVQIPDGPLMQVSREATPRGDNYRPPDEMYRQCEHVRHQPDKSERHLVLSDLNDRALREYVQHSVNWGFSDAGAKTRYVLARMKKLMPFEAFVYEVQSHNPHAQCSFLTYGRRRLNQMICSMTSTDGKWPQHMP
jgi:hypothetical protein